MDPDPQRMKEKNPLECCACFVLKGQYLNIPLHSSVGANTPTLLLLSCPFTYCKVVGLQSSHNDGAHRNHQ